MLFALSATIPNSVSGDGGGPRRMVIVTMSFHCLEARNPSTNDLLGIAGVNRLSLGTL